MWYTDHDYAAQTHCNAGPYGGYPNIPFVKYPSYDRHNYDVIGECPEKIYVYKQIAFFQHTDQGEYFEKVLLEDDYVSSIDVQLTFGVDTDTNGGLLKTRNII